jgi:hypothetical protein
MTRSFERLRQVEGDLSRDGWGVFEDADAEHGDTIVLEELAQACAEARTSAQALVASIHDVSGEYCPTWGVSVHAPQYGSYGLHSDDLKVFQAEDYPDARYGRITVDFILRNKAIPPQPGDPDGMHEATVHTRELALEAGLKALELFGVKLPATLDKYHEIYRTLGKEVADRMCVTGQTQFLHTWYRPDGYLHGQPHREQLKSGRGHRDIPYSGITISRQLTGEQTTWHIMPDKKRRKVVQTPERLIVMSGHINPFHSIEVGDTHREAVLLRLGGEQAEDFMLKFTEK